MPRRCCVWVHEREYDVTNLLDEDSLRNFLRGMTMAVPELQVQRPRRQRRPREFIPLYPSPTDPCNRRLLEDPVMPRWESVPLEKAQPSLVNDKYAEFYELQRRDMERLQQQHHSAHAHGQAQAQAEAPYRHDHPTATGLPQRAQTAPLHSQSSHAPASPTTRTLPTFSSQTTVGHAALPRSDARGRQSLPPVRSQAARMQPQQRHSTTAIPGDIESSSSGLRPRVNYKSLYSRGRNLSASSASSSCHSIYEDVTDTTATMMGSTSSAQYEEDPVPVDEDLTGQPVTMEIAPNVRVAVRSSQETYKAVQSGDYTVATCFACTSAIVCVDDAAYVLCPDCQVVSPLGYGTPTHDPDKKDDPYGIGTGLKREWVNQYIGSSI